MLGNLPRDAESRVESRIVVLSVLWKIREKYRTARKVVEEDMIIISGERKEVKGSANHELEVQLAIINVLRNELGLDVIVGYGTDAPGLLQDTSNSVGILKNVPLNNEYIHLARRPQDLGILKVTKESLCNWLQKREGT